MKFEEYLEMPWESWVRDAVLGARDEPDRLFAHQDTKIGMDHFSGLSIHGCPGSTGLCRSVCYDAKSVKVLFGGTRNLKKAGVYSYLAKHDVGELKRRVKHDLKYTTHTVRVHVGGDFISPEHVRMWKELADESPNREFFAYTRSWRLPEILDELIILNTCTNFKVLCSVDAESGLPQRGEFQIAQMTAIYHMRNSVQCPEQIGKVKDCLTCQKCISKDNKENIIFQIHGNGRTIKMEQLLRPIKPTKKPIRA